MTERTSAEVIAMRRRELAEIHAQEMTATLFPYPERTDDEITDAEKISTRVTVQELVRLHRSEVRIWQSANT